MDILKILLPILAIKLDNGGATRPVSQTRVIRDKCRRYVRHI